MEAQLALGRELTQKQQQSESSDSEEETDLAKSTSSNPWLSNVDPDDTVFSGYKKFWEEHNAVKKLKEAQVEVEADEEPEDSPQEFEQSENSENEEEAQSEDDESEASGSDDEDTSKYINDLFDEAEEKINSKMTSKLAELKPNLLEDEEKKPKKGKKRKSNVQNADYLKFAKKTALGDVDEALNEGDASEDDAPGAHVRTKSLLSEVKQKKKEKQKMFKGDDINPESFLSIQSKHLITAIPTAISGDDVHDENGVHQLSLQNKMSLAEAFENDDIVNDFEEETLNEAKKRNQVEVTALPGWGSWGGVGVKERRPKVQQKTIPKKDRVIINNAPNEKLKKHLISSVPFPFKSVEDFEASMRLPIGKEFIPESAHRKLVMQSVVTKAGTIIEPMSEEILVQNAPKAKLGKKNKNKKRK